MLFLSYSYSHRVCYRMDISDCHDENNRGYYGCRLYLSGPRLGPRLKLKQLSVTRGNHSKVLIDSVNGTESNTVCFYNVSVSNDSSENCSLARLQHKVNHPESKYVDRDTQPDSDSSTDDSLTFTDCRSYVSVYYYSEQGHRHLYGTFCGKQLATLNQLLPATQLFLVSWTNNDVQNNRNSSFHLRAQCIE